MDPQETGIAAPKHAGDKPAERKRQKQKNEGKEGILLEWKTMLMFIFTDMIRPLRRRTNTKMSYLVYPEGGLWTIQPNSVCRLSWVIDQRDDKRGEWSKPCSAVTLMQPRCAPSIAFTSQTPTWARRTDISGQHEHVLLHERVLLRVNQPISCDHRI